MPEMTASATETAEHTQSLASLRLAVIEAARAWDKAAYDHAEWYEKTLSAGIKDRASLEDWKKQNSIMLKATMDAQDEFRRLNAELAEAANG